LVGVLVDIGVRVRVGVLVAAGAVSLVGVLVGNGINVLVEGGGSVGTSVDGGDVAVPVGFDGIEVFDGVAGFDGVSCGGDVGAGAGCTGAGRIGSGGGAGVGGMGDGTDVDVAVGATATTAGRRIGVLAGNLVLVGVLDGGGSVGSTAAGTGICSGSSV
jgi:hypothetical protein